MDRGREGDAGYEELAKGFDRLDCPARNSPLAGGPPTVRQAPGLFTNLLLEKRERERERFSHCFISLYWNFSARTKLKGAR